MFPFEEVAPGSYGSCGVLTNGSVSCWGESTVSRNLVEDAPGGDWDHVSVGGNDACAWTDSNMRCWSSSDSDDAPGISPLTVDVGFSHACAVSGQGKLRCWSDNGQFQSDPPDGEDWIDVAVSARGSCALDADGDVDCWGAF